jgi:hypothetical protein
MQALSRSFLKICDVRNKELQNDLAEEQAGGRTGNLGRLHIGLYVQTYIHAYKQGDAWIAILILVYLFATKE